MTKEHIGISAIKAIGAYRSIVRHDWTRTKHGDDACEEREENIEGQGQVAEANPTSLLVSLFRLPSLIIYVTNTPYNISVAQGVHTHGAGNDK